MGAAETLHVVRQWIEKAEHDLTNATHTLTMGEGCPFDTVCFHAQQCVEKYLKALLAHRGIDSPKTHDIGSLVRLLPKGARPPLQSVEAAELSQYAVEPRYPADEEPITRGEAEAAVESAKRVRAAVRQRLPEEAL